MLLARVRRVGWKKSLRSAILLGSFSADRRLVRRIQIAKRTQRRLRRSAPGGNTERTRRRCRSLGGSVKFAKRNPVARHENTKRTQEISLFQWVAFSSGRTNRGGSTWKQEWDEARRWSTRSTAPADRRPRADAGAALGRRGLPHRGRPGAATVHRALARSCRRKRASRPVRCGVGDSTVRARRPGHRRGPRSHPGRHALAPHRQRARDRAHQDRLLGRPAAARSRNSIRCAIPFASNAAPFGP